MKLDSNSQHQAEFYKKLTITKTNKSEVTSYLHSREFDSSAKKSGYKDTFGLKISIMLSTDEDNQTINDMNKQIYHSLKQYERKSHTSQETLIFENSNLSVFKRPNIFLPASLMAIGVITTLTSATLWVLLATSIVTGTAALVAAIACIIVGCITLTTGTYSYFKKSNPTIEIKQTPSIVIHDTPSLKSVNYDESFHTFNLRL